MELETFYEMFKKKDDRSPHCTPTYVIRLHKMYVFSIINIPRVHLGSDFTSGPEYN